MYANWMQARLLIISVMINYLMCYYIERCLQLLSSQCLICMGCKRFVELGRDDTLEYFNVSNRIRQGGIISPLVYSVYTDILLRNLKDSGIGCFIGHMYVGGMAYANDLKLLCPSIRGLQKMVNICSEFGIEYDILYNETKTVDTC